MSDVRCALSPVTRRLALTQPGDLPAFPVGPADEPVGFREILEGERCRVPIELLIREVRRDASQEHAFGERTGIAEMRRGDTVAADGLDELIPVVDILQP